MLGFAGIVQSGNRGTPLLLDTYSGAAAAYSLRKLRTAYTGSAVRVRRSTDSVEQDIGFDANGNLDESTLQTFCGENLLQRSEEFDNAYWVKTRIRAFGSGSTINAITDPFGGTSADYIQQLSGQTTYGGVYDQNTVATGVVYNISIYAKKKEKNFIVIGESVSKDTSGSSSYTFFDLNNGVVGNKAASHSSASIEFVNNSWYRCSITFTSLVTGFFNNAIFLVADNNGSSTVTDSGGIYIYGAQMNKTTLKPYVQTTTAARDGMGYVTKWYDQSGNARDAAQTTAANQPRIVNAGVVEKQGNKPSVNFNSGGTIIKNFTTSINNSILPTTGSSSAEWIIVAKATSLGASSEGSLLYLGNSNNYVPNFHNNIISNNSTANWYFNNYDGTERRVSGGSIYTYSLIYAYRNGINNILRINGSQISSVSTGSPNVSSSASLIIGGIIVISGGSTGYFYDGFMSEIILYPSAQASRTDIESNINTYFNIY